MGLTENELRITVPEWDWLGHSTWVLLLYSLVLFWDSYHSYHGNMGCLWLFYTHLGSYFPYWNALLSHQAQGFAQSCCNIICCFIDTHRKSALFLTDRQGCDGGEGIEDMRRRDWERRGSGYYSQDVKQINKLTKKAITPNS